MTIAVLTSVMHSGSTLLLDMLRCHPKVFSGFEFKLLFYEDVNKWHQECNHYFKYFNFSEKELEILGSQTNWEEVYQLCFEFIQQKQTKTFDVFVDKTPHYELPVIRDKLPRAKIIGMFRDPRSVYLSWQKRFDFRKNTTLDEFAQIYRKYTSPLFAPDVLLVRYEDLISNPSQVLNKVCDYLSLEFIDKMCNPKNADPPSDKVIYEFPHMSKRQKRPLVNGLDKNILLDWQKLEESKQQKLKQLLSDIPQVFCDEGETC